MSKGISGTSNRSYGGKLGVWLTKKRNIQIPRHRNNSFRNRNRQHQQHHHHLLHTLLPGRLGVMNSRDRRIAGRGIGNGIAQNVNAMNRGSNVNINTSLVGGNGLIGWDEVRCRPVYLNSQNHNSVPGVNENDKENVDASNDASMGRTETSEYDVSASNNDDDVAMQNIDSGDGDGDGESQYASNEDDGDKNKKSSLFDAFPIRDYTAVIQHSQYKYSKTRGKIKGKTYGNNNKRIGRLSTMASSVLDAYASPLWKTKPYGKKKRKNGTGSTSTSTFASSIPTDSDSIVKISGSTSSTSSKNDTTMTLSSSSSGSSPLSDAASSSVHFDSAESNECTGEFEFEASDDSRYRKRKSSSISSSSNSTKNNVCLKQKKKQAAKRKLKKEGKSLLQQPNCTTCLKDAKAYFQHLDGYQLNIDSF